MLLKEPAIQYTGLTLEKVDLFILIVLQIWQRHLYFPIEQLTTPSHTSLACASAIFRLFSSSIRSSSSRFARSSS